LLDQDRREAVAFALFAHQYGEEDPTFPGLYWASMLEAQKAPWYRQADVALAAASEIRASMYRDGSCWP